MPKRLVLFIRPTSWTEKAGREGFEPTTLGLTVLRSAPRELSPLIFRTLRRYNVTHSQQRPLYYCLLEGTSDACAHQPSRRRYHYKFGIIFKESMHRPP